MSGDLAPCTPLAQEELAEQLGVSRQPISHALILLRREGLVVDRGGKGQMVAPIDADRLLGLYQVRGALDRLAARLTAAGQGATKAKGHEFGNLIERGKAAAATGDIGKLVDADFAFHMALHDMSENAEISATVSGFWPHMVRSMRVVLEDESAWTGIWVEHAAIADAVMSGDVDRAGELAANHADKAGEATYLRLANL